MPKDFADPFKLSDNYDIIVMKRRDTTWKTKVIFLWVLSSVQQ
jgi:hypothetical protein